MGIDKPRDDQGDMGPSWAGNADQFTKVRDLLVKAFNSYARAFTFHNHKKTDTLINKILYSFRGSDLPENDTKEFIAFLKKNVTARHVFQEAIRMRLKDEMDSTD